MLCFVYESGLSEGERVGQQNVALHCFSFLCSVSGPLEAQDVLVLTIDMLQFETHAAAVETVINHFGQVCKNLYIQ